MTIFKIKDAAPNDCAEIARIHRLSRQQVMPYLPDLHSADEDTEFYRNNVFQKCCVKIALDGKKIIGFCAFSVEWLDHLYIAPDYQCHGIGTTLLKTAGDAQDKLQLWVFQKNLNARRFYEKHGFQLVEMTDGTGNEEQEPDARYEWINPFIMSSPP